MLLQDNLSSEKLIFGGSSKLPIDTHEKVIKFNEWKILRELTMSVMWSKLEYAAVISSSYRKKKETKDTKSSN